MIRSGDASSASQARCRRPQAGARVRTSAARPVTLAVIAFSLVFACVIAVKLQQEWTAAHAKPTRSPLGLQTCSPNARRGRIAEIEAGIRRSRPPKCPRSTPADLEPRHAQSWSVWRNRCGGQRRSADARTDGFSAKARNHRNAASSRGRRACRPAWRFARATAAAVSLAIPAAFSRRLGRRVVVVIFNPRR
jgi:hypothetical protein